jgi:hypothetical protein
MNAADLRRTIESDYADALDRLGSRHLLTALGGEDPDAEALLTAVAHSEYAARETFRAWAETAVDDDIRETYERVVTQEDRHHRLVCGELDGGTTSPSGAGPMHAYLRDREDPVHRVAGGMVGRTLVSLRTHDRLVRFFEGRDEDVESLLQTMRTETADCLDDGLSTLDARTAPGDWDAVAAVAGYTVRLAADDVETTST